MPAAIEVVREYARYHAFACNLDLARPRVERAPDWTVVNVRNFVVPQRLGRAATTACRDQGTYNDRDNVNPFYSQHISPTLSERDRYTLVSINASSFDEDDGLLILEHF